MRLKLETEQEQFEKLHKDVNAARRSTIKVEVNREALAALLRDHSRLLAAHQGIIEQ